MAEILEFKPKTTNEEYRLECECGCQLFSIAEDGCTIFCAECDNWYNTVETEWS